MKLFKILGPLLVLVICAGISWLLLANKPEVKRRHHPRRSLVVEAMRLQRQNFPITLRSQGTVRPRTESTLIPEVSGRVVKVAPAFRPGGFFEQGDVLLQIDARNYEVAMTVAEAALSDARLSLHEESARGKQAMRDWTRLSQGGKPSDLVLRKPQLARARAALASVEAQLKKARLDVERTKIQAPYAGRVLEQQVDVGQYVSPGTVLAKIYAVDIAEIRLPLTNRQLAYVDLPETYRGDAQHKPLSGPRVLIKARIGNTPHQWPGVIVRTEGAVDVQSRQLFVVAQVNDPYGKSVEGRPPLKVGQFIEALIQGRAISNAFVIPRSAIREGNQVLLVDDESRLQRRTVSIVWSDSKQVVIREGLKEGALICTTTVSFAANGALVQAHVAGEETPLARKKTKDEVAL